MATLDFTPLLRSTIGFDRFSQILDHAWQAQDANLGYPPYNIEKSGEDKYAIVMAVAGFTPNDLEIVSEQNRLIVRGRMANGEDKTYLHRGIASRAFERTFDLADFIKVTGATLKDGLLTIELVRELPEALKPRKIEIGVPGKQPQVQELEAKNVA